MDPYERHVLYHLTYENDAMLLMLLNLLILNIHFQSSNIHLMYCLPGICLDDGPMDFLHMDGSSSSPNIKSIFSNILLTTRHFKHIMKVLRVAQSKYQNLLPSMTSLFSFHRHCHRTWMRPS